MTGDAGGRQTRGIAAGARGIAAGATGATGSTRVRDPLPVELARAPRDRVAEVASGLALLAAAGGGVALAASIVFSSSTQLQGLLVFIAFGGLGAALVIWSHRLLPRLQYEEQRHSMATGDAAPHEVAASLVAQRGLSRRSALRWLLGAALGGLGLAFAAPLLALGPPPDNLRQTAWRRGLRLIGDDGTPIRAGVVPFGGIRTVFPEGALGSAQAQAVLIHVEPGFLQLPPDRLAVAPHGFIVYSRVCTHAGCPVGLYRATTHELVCPCHQSTFAVLHGAVPVFGPAARPLPQLPIALQADGTFIALGDFPEPVGPSFWDRTTAVTNDGPAAAAMTPVEVEVEGGCGSTCGTCAACTGCATRGKADA